MRSKSQKGEVCLHSLYYTSTHTNLTIVELEASLLNTAIHLKPSTNVDITTQLPVASVETLEPDPTALDNLSKWISRRGTHLEIQISGAGKSSPRRAISMGSQRRKASEAHEDEVAKKRTRSVANSANDGGLSISTKKRRTAKTRKDIYENPSDREEQVADDVPTAQARSTRGKKKAVMAKKPIELRNLNGGHNTRSVAMTTGNIPPSSPSQSPTQSQHANVTRQSSKANNVRKLATRSTRSRHPDVEQGDAEDRDAPEEDTGDDESVEDAAQQQTSKARPSRTSGIRNSNGGGNRSDEVRDDEGRTTMLLAPSSQKFVPPRRAHRDRFGAANSAVAASEPRSPHEELLAAEEQSEEEEERSESEVEMSKGIGRKLTEETFPEDQVHVDLLFKLATIDLMRRNARQVCHSKGGDSSSEEEATPPRKTQRALAKVILNRARELTRIYKATVVEDGEKIESIASTRDLLARLVEAATEIVDYLRTTKLRNARSVVMLEDLFFHGFPALLDTLFHAAKIYTLQKNLPDSSLADITIIVTTLRRLSDAALKHKKASPDQGLKRKNRRYLFEQPMDRNMASLTRLHNALINERGERDEKVEILRRKATAAERREQVNQAAELRQQALVAAKEERDRRIKENEERRRVQILSGFNHPALGPLLLRAAQKELDRSRNDEMVDSARLRVVSHYNRQPQADNVGSRAESDEQGEDDEDEIERVSVFDYDTRSKSVAPPPWTQQERDAFLKIMRACNREWHLFRSGSAKLMY